MLSVGAKAPDFVLPTLSGEAVSLGEISRSKAVLLAFFKISCPTCQYTLPFLDRLREAPQLEVVGISQDDAKATAEFCRTYGLSFPVALDDARTEYRVSNAYKITHVPSLFLVEANSINHTFSGFSRRDLEDIGQRFGVPMFRPGERTPDFRPG
jgi:peroxiredoxin